MWNENDTELVTCLSCVSIAIRHSPHEPHRLNYAREQSDTGNTVNVLFFTTFARDISPFNSLNIFCAFWKAERRGRVGGEERMTGERE